MSDARHERRQHFRGKPRPGRRLAIRYRIRGGEWIRAETRNIGVGGAFVSTGEPAAPGSPVEIELEVPTCEQPLILRGQVRWAEDGVGDHAGMGVQFQDVDIDVLLELNDYFASLTGVEFGA
ncbi:MAG: PilZ domain-containing protein [Kofleriaceae bacterium]|nr:PilZ domain-containing protein [Myxococcales bacterium]MCB9572137.1 PilZ domain-containing protein [Kofleriaceae bacterium]